MKFKRKTFDNTFLFTVDQSNADKSHRKITEFIFKTNRIDKTDPAFAGIIEETKRYQNTAILFSVLMNPKVVLCINDTELPAAFKVFEANDLKTKEGAKIFVDCSGLITLSNGYFVCKKIDIFFTRLYQALNHLIYQNDPIKYLANSNVTINATQCYVSMVIDIIDYLRILGFQQNSAKISYLTGLFFLHNMMQKDIDQYAMNIAAKAAKISAADTRAMSLYYNESDFATIDSFISMLSNTFKLKGLTTEVFMSSWLYRYGKGTEFGTELFPSFVDMMVAAYVGAYVVHQKAIEKSCGNSMVNLVRAITQLGSSIFNTSSFLMGEQAEEFHKVVSKEASDMRKRLNMQKPAGFTVECFEDIEHVKSIVNEMNNYYRSSIATDKDQVFGDGIAMGLKALKEGKYANGAIELLLNNCEVNRRKLMSTIDRYIESYNDEILDLRDEAKDDELKEVLGKKTELISIKSAL
jgi:hypothetical protein